MKPYLAFYMMNYYPAGGALDLIGHYETMVEAHTAIEANRITRDDDKRHIDAHIYCVVSEKIVWEMKP